MLFISFSQVFIPLSNYIDVESGTDDVPVATFYAEFPGDPSDLL